ncbi:MAG: hypothetical protein ACI8PD_001051 [Nitrospinales bacterium]|jgi:hypothetical protein
MLRHKKVLYFIVALRILANYLNLSITNNNVVIMGLSHHFKGLKAIRFLTTTSVALKSYVFTDI